MQFDLAFWTDLDSAPKSYAGCPFHRAAIPSPNAALAAKLHSCAGGI